MLWRVSCKIAAESQNRRIIGGSNPSVSFQVREQGFHVVRFLFSSSMSLSLLVKDTHIYWVSWEPRVREGFCSPWQGKQTRQACDGCLPGRRTASLRWTLTRHERFSRSDVLFLHKARWSNHRSDGTSSTVTNCICIQLTCGSVAFWLIRVYQMKKIEILLPKFKGCVF